MMSETEPGTIIGVRNGAPLVAATDPDGGAFFASDAQPILEYAREVIFLENGDVAVGNAQGLKIIDLESGKPVQRAATKLDWSPEKLDKQGYAHYMLKEIYEQPAALVDTLNGLLDRAHSDAFPLAAQPGVEILRNAREIILVACGTSWHAAWVGKYWLEKWARIPVQVELASEFRYREPVLSPGTIVVGLSQSGETADTLAVIREVKRSGNKAIAITNVRGSTLSREADAVFHTYAGPEIGVAATKTFTAQLVTLLCWAGFLAREKKRPGVDEWFQKVLRLPHQMEELLMEESPTPGVVSGRLATCARETARAVQNSKGFFFIGRGYSYPMALEGALKLKEIAYVNAEGYAAGELKHGPIAMIDKDMTVIVLAPKDSWRDKTVSNLEEVKARGARIVGVGSPGDKLLQQLCDHWIPIGEWDETLLPFALSAAVQLFSYELALLKGTDIDKPRNLAKSVTVE